MRIRKKTDLACYQCGKIRSIIRIDLNASCKPCGYERTKKDTHDTRTNISYGHMMSRCYDANHPSYNNYGDRGISVCPEWKGNYAQFVKDMGFRPKDKTLDRIDNDKGYSRENCRWATKEEQGLNRRANKFYEAFGEKLTAAQWAKKLGFKNPATIRNRVITHKWSVEKALTTPMKKKS